MSIKQELKVLNSKRKTLELQLEPFINGLTQLYFERNSLTEKLNKLSNRTSPLANTLREGAIKELSVINKQITSAEEAKKEIKERIEEINKEISKRIDSTDFYIKEQSEVMTKAFLEYIESNRESIGSEITKTFEVSEITIQKEDRYGGCDVPTGTIGIYDEKTETFIISSSDFYFSNDLFTLDRGGYDALICLYTAWYREYRDKFISTFLNTLKDQFSSEDFKLTINNTEFTLELV